MKLPFYPQPKPTHKRNKPKRRNVTRITKKVSGEVIRRTGEVDKVIKKQGLCECGCGCVVIPPIRFVSGHNLPKRNSNYIYKNGRPYTTITCDHCGKKAERRIDSVNRRGNKNYCSSLCGNRANVIPDRTFPQRKTGKTVKCKMCRTEFYVQKAKISYGFGKFCSIECRGSWLIDHPRKGFTRGNDNSGKKNGMYKHGGYVGKKRDSDTAKRKTRPLVIERDGGNWCLICGLPGPGLHLHRVIYGSQGGKYELGNCVQLCRDHHEEVHTSKKKWYPIFKEYLDNEWKMEFRDTLRKLYEGGE